MARIQVGVAYESDPEKARAIMLQLAEAQPGVLRYPPPYVAFVGFGASSIDMAINVFVSDVNGGGPIKTELAFKILKAFREAGIEMPYPQQDIRLRDLDPVRDVLSRVIEERRRQPANDARAASPGHADDAPTPFRPAAPLRTV